jgi:hypothetical protein
MKPLHASSTREGGSQYGLAFAAKVASAMQPGRTFRTVAGSRALVLAKSVSVDGVRLRVRVGKTSSLLTVAGLAALGPVTPAIRRLASLVRHIIAVDKSIATYVSEAIKAAGLPEDPTMRWGTMLQSMYVPVLRKFTQDQDLIEDAIRDVVIQELFEKRILSPTSQGYHFDPARLEEGKPLEKKVSAFLSMVFKHRVSEAIDFVKVALGPGTGGALGRTNTESISMEDQASGVEALQSAKKRRSELSLTNRDLEDSLGQAEVDRFLSAFQKYVDRTQRKVTARIFQAITDGVRDGLDRGEIKERIQALKLQARDGQAVNPEIFKYLMRKWADQVKTFAGSPEEGWADIPVARMISQAAASIAGEGQKQKVTSLRQAAPINPNVQQQLTFLPRQTTPAPVPPAPQAPPPPPEDGFTRPEDEEEEEQQRNGQPAVNRAAIPGGIR